MNRRLREIDKDLENYRNLLKNAETISDSLIYQGKIESLERERNKIIKRYE